MNLPEKEAKERRQAREKSLFQLLADGSVEVDMALEGLMNIVKDHIGEIRIFEYKGQYVAMDPWTGVAVKAATEEKTFEAIKEALYHHYEDKADAVAADAAIDEWERTGRKTIPFSELEKEILKGDNPETEIDFGRPTGEEVW